MKDLFKHPPETECPRCGSREFSWRQRRLQSLKSLTSLVTARALSKMARRIVRLEIWCKSCRSFFSSIHPLPRIVVGYHGCHRQFAADLIAGRADLEAWRMSQNDYDWLGEGVYFWEYAPGRAWQWARERYREEGAVVATEVHLGRCLDLADTAFTDLIRRSYDGTVALYKSLGGILPKNGGRDFKLRKLDRLVIDRVTKTADGPGGVHYQTIRCPFEEGEPVYDGGMIRTQSHVQIAVRDRACIGTRIYPIGPEGG